MFGIYRNPRPGLSSRPRHRQQLLLLTHYGIEDSGEEAPEAGGGLDVDEPVDEAGNGEIERPNSGRYWPCRLTFSKENPSPSMVGRRLQRFVYAQVGWMLSWILVLVLLDALSLELFYAVSFIGFFLLREITMPLVTIQWRRRLWWFTLLGALFFGVAVVKHVVESLPPGLL